MDHLASKKCFISSLVTFEKRFSKFVEIRIKYNYVILLIQSYFSKQILFSDLSQTVNKNVKQLSSFQITNCYIFSSDGSCPSGSSTYSYTVHIATTTEQLVFDSTSSSGFNCYRKNRKHQIF